MTGTAMTEATEFWKIYKLDVIAIPTNRSMQRIEHPDVIYRTEREKFNAVADEIERMHKWDVLVLKDGDEYWSARSSRKTTTRSSSSRSDKQAARRSPASKIEQIERQGRPILVGTVSIEKSERLSRHCSTSAASSTKCSTPSITSARPRSSPRPAAWAP